MTLPADNDDQNKNAGKSLATSGSSPVNPFLAAAASDRIEAPLAQRPFISRMLDYSAHAAIIAGLIGFTWTVGDHVVNRTTPKSEAPTTTAAAPHPVDEMAQLQASNQKMHDEIKALKASVDTLRTALRRDTTPEQVRMLSAGLDTLKASVASTNATLEQLDGKIDKLQPGKIQQLAERLARLERQPLDPATTASIGTSDTAKADAPRPDAAALDASKTVPQPPAKPASLASAEASASPSDTDKPQVLTGWVVRDVYQGVALVEGKHGSMEVVPGVAIPGAGVVKSIEKHGTGWTVTTTKGQFASAASAPRDYRRVPYQGAYQQRGGYPPYRYDY
jgi:hypothetical protein